MFFSFQNERRREKDLGVPRLQGLFSKVYQFLLASACETQTKQRGLFALQRKIPYLRNKKLLLLQGCLWGNKATKNILSERHNKIGLTMFTKIKFSL